MKLVTLLSAAVLALAVPAAAQQTPNRGQPATDAAAKLVVSATRPVSEQSSINGKDSLRVMLRLSSADGGLVPFVVERDANNYAVGWTAFTASAVSCSLRPRSIDGAPNSNRSDFGAVDPSSWNVEGNRPSIVTANFLCDGAVQKDEFLTVQARFFVRINGQWRQADYVFENIQVAMRR